MVGKSGEEWGKSVLSLLFPYFNWATEGCRISRTIRYTIVTAWLRHQEPFVKNN